MVSLTHNEEGLMTLLKKLPALKFSIRAAELALTP